MDNPFDDPLGLIENMLRRSEENRQKRIEREQKEHEYFATWERAISQPSVQRLIDLAEELHERDVKRWINFYVCEIKSLRRVVVGDENPSPAHLRSIVMIDILFDALAGNREDLHERLNRALQVMHVQGELEYIKEAFHLWMHGGDVATPWITRQELVKSLKGDTPGKSNIPGLSASGITRAIKNEEMVIQGDTGKFQRYLHRDYEKQKKILDFVCDYLKLHKIV